MLKYLKGEALKFRWLGGKDASLPAPLVSDFDLLNPILMSWGSKDLGMQQLKGNAIMALADRLIERAKYSLEQINEVQAHLFYFYFVVGVELDRYLPVFFPEEFNTPKQKQSGDETPLPQTSLNSSSAIVS